MIFYIILFTTNAIALGFLAFKGYGEQLGFLSAMNVLAVAVMVSLYYGGMSPC